MDAYSGPERRRSRCIVEGCSFNASAPELAFQISDDINAPSDQTLILRLPLCAQHRDFVTSTVERFHKAMDDLSLTFDIE